MFHLLATVMATGLASTVQVCTATIPFYKPPSMNFKIVSHPIQSVHFSVEKASLMHGAQVVFAMYPILMLTAVSHHDISYNYSKCNYVIFRYYCQST